MVQSARSAPKERREPQAQASNRHFKIPQLKPPATQHGRWLFLYVGHSLGISQGTAKTHIRSIYHKMDIHTQQDLMDLIEAMAGQH